MTTWNYRIVRYHGGGGLGLHEVYYDEKGKPTHMTESPVSFFVVEDETSLDLIKSLKAALSDAERYPVLNEPAEWSKKPPSQD
jgi:hypothetical protein